MSDTSSSSDQFYWDDNPYHWLGGDEQGEGEEDHGEGTGDGHGEGAGDGHGGGEDDHLLNHLPHLMILPQKVPIWDNDDMGTEMQNPAPGRDLYQTPLLQMMAGTNLSRTPPGGGTKSKVTQKDGEVGADKAIVDGKGDADKDRVEGGGAAVDAGIVVGAQGEGRQGEEGANVDAHAGRKVKTRNTRCNACRSCKQNSCPSRNGDTYSCLSCLAKYTCVLRPPCEAWPKSDTKLWLEQVIPKNNALVQKRPDAIEHIITTLDDRTATVFILANQVKAKIYPNIEKELVVEQEEDGEKEKEKGRVAFEDKVINMMQQFKVDTDARHASEVNQLKNLFAEHLDKQAKLIQGLVKIKGDTEGSNLNENEDGDSSSRKSTGSNGSDFKFRPPPSAPLFSPPPHHRRHSSHTPPVAGHTPPVANNDDAIARLASVLKKKFDNPSKPSARLPAFALPPMQLAGGQPTGTSYWSWRAKCIQLFHDNGISDSVAVHLLTSEKSIIPKKWTASISNCTSIEQVFKILDSQTPSKESILPNLVKQLTEMSSAFSNAEQLDLCDRLCRILVQMQTFFPERDLTLCELTACLSAFQSQHEISLLPSLLKDFKLKKSASNMKFVDILYDYAKEKRSDLHDILAALNQYRRDEPVHHQNILMNGGRRGGGGRGGRRGRSRGKAGGGNANNKIPTVQTNEQDNDDDTDDNDDDTDDNDDDTDDNNDSDESEE